MRRQNHSNMNRAYGLTQGAQETQIVTVQQKMREATMEGKADIALDLV